MSDDTAITADDWGAAMSEQASSAGTDDWAAAMAEQETAPVAPAAESKAHVFEKFGSTAGATTQNDLDMILDIPVQLTVELGRTKMPIKNLLQLAQGSVVELSGMAGEPLDVMINGFLIAQGEVVVVNDKLGIRLTDITTPSERLRRINR
jgi:flagellar motor switch protein FliN/FliY